MDQLDQYRAAKLLIDRFGDDAKAHAMGRVLAMRKAQDDAGEWAWIGVFDAVLELEAKRPGSEMLIH